MNKTLILFVLILGGALWASSQKANYFQVNQIGSSAKMISQGSVKGFSNTASVIFDNPASLEFIDKWSVSIFKTTLMADLNYRNLAAGYKTKYGTWAIGYMDLKVGEVPNTRRVNNRNVVDHYFDYTNSVLKVGYQNKMTKNLYYGALWSIFKTNMDTVKGKGSNIDIGLYWKLKKIDVSLAMKNIINAAFCANFKGCSTQVPGFNVLANPNNASSLISDLIE